MSTEPSPREVDIAFSTPMILAEREGRKTVTRRIIKQPPPWANDPQMAVGEWLHFHGHHPHEPCGHPACSCTASDAPAMWTTKLRYKVGDILRVREAAWMWCAKLRDGNKLTPKGRPKYRYETFDFLPIFYAADHPHQPTARETAEIEDEAYRAPHFGWRLKIPRFLPGWAVRTRLRVTSVRVERLHSITEEDAIREGVTAGLDSAWWQIVTDRGSYSRGNKELEPVVGTDEGLGEIKFYQWRTMEGETALSRFKTLWYTIHGPGSWDANPWVARIEFERLK